jgi:transposase
MEDATMFVKTTKSKGREYIKLVESYRDENKVTRHRVLFNFGRSDLLKDDKSFINIVKRLCEIAELGTAESSPLLDCGEAQIFKYGYLPYLKLWETLGIGNCLRRIQEQTKCEYSLNEATFLMAAQHLLLPKSKLATHEYQANYIGLNEIDLHQMYRALDKLGENKETIEDELFYENFTKVGHSVDVVFYDVTTFAFESVIRDELKNFGFSKECKFNEVQVVMGLLVDSNGFPIGYELFPGNTFEGKTITAALDNISRRFGINKVVIVADRGINSKGNLKAIKEAGYGYIVASKIKGMKKSVQELILDGGGFTKASDDLSYKIIDYTNTFKDENGKVHNLQENLIISYSEKRARKDIHDRQRLLDKARKMLENPSNIKSSNKRGGKKYLKEAGETATYSLDEQQIEKDSLFDGYYGIETSEKEMSAPEIIEAYHSLWRIEECFRIMKSTLEVQPIYHWKPHRIHGHFVLCFLAFMLERKMELLLNEHGVENSPGKIRDSLNSMQVAMVEYNGEEVYIKAKNLPLAYHIWKAMKLKLPKSVNSKKDLGDILSVEKKNLWGQLSLF